MVVLEGQLMNVDVNELAMYAWAANFVASPTSKACPTTPNATEVDSFSTNLHFVLSNTSAFSAISTARPISKSLGKAELYEWNMGKPIG